MSVSVAWKVGSSIAPATCWGVAAKGWLSSNLTGGEDSGPVGWKKLADVRGYEAWETDQPS